MYISTLRRKKILYFSSRSISLDKNNFILFEYVQVYTFIISVKAFGLGAFS